MFLFTPRDLRTSRLTVAARLVAGLAFLICAPAFSAPVLSSPSRLMGLGFDSKGSPLLPLGHLLGWWNGDSSFCGFDSSN